MSIKILGTILTTLCIAALISTNAFATDCKTLCSDAGYSNYHCDGAAPFCGDGKCSNGSGGDSALWANGTGYIYCAGSCSDGDSCLSGNKQCYCWNPIDCEAECTKSVGTAECATHISTTGTGTANSSLSILGACGWNGGVEQCYCEHSGSTHTGF